MNDIRLAVSDLDGTLLKKGESGIKKEFLAMIKEIKTDGIDFAVASGRPYAELKQFFSSVLYDMYFICENGALVYYKGKVLYKKCIQDKIFREVIDLLDASHIEWAAAGVHTIYTIGGNQKVAGYYKNEGLSIMKVRSVREIPESILRLSICMTDAGTDRLENVLNTRYPQDVNIIYEDSLWMDIVAGGVNKGTAVSWLLSRLGIEPKEILVFGDNVNDIELLGITGNSYAMAWAEEKVKKHAEHTTDCVMKSIRSRI